MYQLELAGDPVTGLLRKTGIRWGMGGGRTGPGWCRESGQGHSGGHQGSGAVALPEGALAEQWCG